MKKFIPLVCLVALVACSSTDEKTPEQQPEKPVETLYNEAADALDAKQYTQATQLFNEVERQHPYSKWATKAQLMAAYSAYENENYIESILAVDRFLRLHPGNKDVDYALYLKALNFYDQISDVGRDQDMTQMAKDNFEQLLRAYPNSKYARDAKLKLDLTLDHLAGKEMSVGRYYLVRNQYAILGFNYPGSSWYEDTYKLLDDTERAKLLDDRGFVDKTMESLFRPE